MEIANDESTQNVGIARSEIEFHFECLFHSQSLLFSFAQYCFP